MKLRELPGLHVSVDEVVYADSSEGTPEKPHRFVYFLTIWNDADTAVTIRGRKWVVREADGETIVVEGDGVVGEFPRLEPGTKFSYNSSHIVASDAVSEGAYFGVTDAGEGVFTRIPPFRLTVPG